MDLEQSLLGSREWLKEHGIKGIKHYLGRVNKGFYCLVEFVLVKLILYEFDCLFKTDRLFGCDKEGELIDGRLV